MKILIAMPVYDGHVPVQVVTSLLSEQAIASGIGVEIRTAFLPACSHAAVGRNQLVQTFLETDCDKLFFLDSDIVFQPGSITKLCHYPVDLVGGCYRLKQKREMYPIGWIQDRQFLQADSNGLLEVASLPGGFVSISRNVFETLEKAHPERKFDHMGHKSHAFYQMQFKDGALQGEDSGFCHEYREAGGRVYLDPEISLTHLDFNPTPYVGHIGNWLKGRVKELENVSNMEIPQVKETSPMQVCQA